MTQQINLYDAALLRRREWLSAANLAVATLTLAAVMTGWSLSARAQLAALEAESRAVASQLASLRERVTGLAARAAALKPDARLEAELASARALLSLRGDVLAALDKGLGSGATGFGEYLRALARQSVGGLWLTGFTVAEGGSGMEIRGRMTDPALLPEYLRKLNGEPAFQGRAFATLTVSAASTPSAAPPAQAQALVPPQATPSQAPAPRAAPPRSAPPYHEFVLAPSAPAAEVRR